jgi:TRAP-type C4-dicarboxylate transport system permease small subunit
MDRLLNAYCRALEALIALALALMVLMVFGNVVLRYAFNSGITVSEELSRWLFVWLTFLGAIVGLKERAHLGTDVLVSRLGPGGRRACLAVGQVAMIGVTAVLLHGSWTQARINLDVEAPITGASMAWIYAAGVVFAASALPLLALELWRTVSGRRRDDELVMVQESEELRAAPGGAEPGARPSRDRGDPGDAP